MLCSIVQIFLLTKESACYLALRRPVSTIILSFSLQMHQVSQRFIKMPQNNLTVVDDAESVPPAMLFHQGRRLRSILDSAYLHSILPLRKMHLPLLLLFRDNRLLMLRQPPPHRSRLLWAQI